MPLIREEFEQKFREIAQKPIAMQIPRGPTCDASATYLGQALLGICHPSQLVSVSDTGRETATAWSVITLTFLPYTLGWGRYPQWPSLLPVGGGATRVISLS